MANVREFDVETVIINLLSARAELTGITIAHHTRAADVAANQITVSALRGELVREGPGGYLFEVEVSVGLGIRRDTSVSGFDSIIRVIDDELTDPGGDGDAGDFFTYFEIREDQESDKESSEKEMRRMARVVVHALGL